MTVIVAPSTEQLVAGDPPAGRSRGVVQLKTTYPDRFDLWLTEIELDVGAAVEWPADHPEIALLVVDGRVDLADTQCPPGTVLGLEADAPARLEAIVKTRMIAFGSSTRREGSPRRVHVIGPGPTSKLDQAAEDQVAVGYFLDGTCDGCSLSLHEVTSSAAYTSSSHRHSLDELIYVASGEAFVGPTRIPAGSTVAVPADRQYRLRSSGALRFYNFRTATSVHRHRATDPGTIETAESQGCEPTFARHLLLTAAGETA